MDFPVNLYCTDEPVNVEEIELCRGDDDFRMVYIVDTGERKIVIKYTSNTFTDRERILGWGRLMDAYRKTGIYCPAMVPNLNNELVHSVSEGGRTFFVYAEEYAKYETADKMEKRGLPDYNSNLWQQDALRNLGAVASLKLDFMNHPSAYCLLEPFSPPDITDEATECANIFTERVKSEFPEYSRKAEAVFTEFEACRESLRQVYHTLPTSCFQADFNKANILVNESGRFMGLIDFNLSGREPVLNYAVRAALELIHDPKLYGENGSCLYYYDRSLDDRRMRHFLDNIRLIEENYIFGDEERRIFPLILRYINSYWWHHINELDSAKDKREKVSEILDWLYFQLNRDDIRLP